MALIRLAYGSSALCNWFYGTPIPSPLTFVRVPMVVEVRSLQRYSSQHDRDYDVSSRGRTNLVQPPAVQMGRASNHSGYNTAPLKRYPPSLCKTIAKLSFIFAEHSEGTVSSADDGLHDIASQLEGLYQTVCEGSVDGADFCGGAYPTWVDLPFLQLSALGCVFTDSVGLGKKKPIQGRFPFWLIFFRQVETTN